MSPVATMEEVLEAFGRAAYHTQLMEYNIVSIWMLDSVTQGASLSKQDLLRFQGDWGKKTFGRLLKPLQRSSRLSEEIKEFLERLRVTRNRLIHRFFLDVASDLQNDTGRQRTVTELQQMTELLVKEIGRASCRERREI